MDDNYSLTPAQKVLALLDFVNEQGPKCGLNLHKDKNKMLLTTTGTNFLSQLPMQLQHDLQTAANKYCKGTFWLDGLKILGTPIGSPTYTQQHLMDFASEFENTLSTIRDVVADPNSKLQLFLHSTQHQVPFRLYINACLPTTTMTLERTKSPFTTRIKHAFTNFLSDLTDTYPLPEHSWALATLPIRQGGLGIIDPEQRSVALFLRPLLRSLRTVYLGFSIHDYSGPQPTSTRIQFPVTIKEPFSSCTDSALPWLQTFTSLLYKLFTPNNPNFDLLSWMLDTKASPITAMTKACEEQAMANYEQLLPSLPPCFTKVEKSIISHFTSVALTSLPRAPAAHRVPPAIFIIMLKRKLRLPILTTPLRCKCSQIIDIYGDHYLSCNQHSKTTMHDRFRDAVAVVFSHLATNASLIGSYADVTCEPTGLLPSLPLQRPADICVHLSPGMLSSWSHLLVDVTSIPFYDSRHDPNPSPVERLHECAENKKFRGTHHNKNEVLAAILQHRYVMLPCTFDSGGLLGPLFSAFLFGQNNDHHSILRISQPRPKRNLVNPQVEALADRTLSMLPKPGLFIMANSSWQESHPTTPFTDHFPLNLPSQWATAVIGNNLILAIGRHLEDALSFSLKEHHSTVCKAVACQPRIPRPRRPFPPLYPGMSV